MYKRLLVIVLFLLVAGCTSEPKTDEEFIVTGTEAFTKQEFSKARDYLGTAVSRKPSDRQVLFYLGLSYSRDYLYDSAYYYLQRLNLLYPKDIEANREIYNLAIELKEWEGAMDALSTLIEAGDEPSQYWDELSELNKRVGRYENAFTFKKLLLEKEPENPTRYLELANVAALIDSVDLALDIIERATEKFGERQELLVNKGLYLAVAQRFTESESILRKLVLDDSTFIPARLNLAHTLASQKDIAKKREAYNLYLQLEPIATGNLSIDSMLVVLKDELSIK